MSAEEFNFFMIDGALLPSDELERMRQCERPGELKYIQLERSRASISADEVIAKIASGAEYSAERIFAVGLIELAIAEIIGGEL